MAICNKAIQILTLCCIASFSSNTWQKIRYSNKKGFSYENRVYESVDDKCLSWDTSQKSMKNRIHATKSLTYPLFLIISCYHFTASILFSGNF